MILCYISNQGIGYVCIFACLFVCFWFFEDPFLFNMILFLINMFLNVLKYFFAMYESIVSENPTFNIFLRWSFVAIKFYQISVKNEIMLLFCKTI